MTGEATPDALSGTGSGSPNLLLFSLFGDTPPESPDPTSVVIGSHTVVLVQNNGKRGRGIATIRVEDPFGTPVSGVTVDGEWSGDFSGPASAATDASGTATLQTAMIRNASSFTYCVTGLTGSNINNTANLPDCASSGSTDPDPGPDPDPEPEPSVPTGLSVQYKENGRWRAILNWTGGADFVDVYSEGGLLEANVPNTGSYKDADQGSSYFVCNAGTGPSGECSNTAS